MTIFICIPQHYIAEAVASLCIRNEHSCAIFQTATDIHEAIKGMTKKPDLIILDYLLFDHNLFNAYDYMKSKKYFIPIIFYNDPFPDMGERAVFWECTLQLIYGKNFHAELYSAIFQKIETLVESDNLRHYIPLLQPPQNTPDIKGTDDESATKTSALEISALQAKLSLNGTFFMLLSILYENKDSTISAHEISEKLTKKGCPVKKRTVYSLVMRLREKLNAQKDIDANIITVSGGYKLILL